MKTGATGAARQKSRAAGYASHMERKRYAPKCRKNAGDQAVRLERAADDSKNKARQGKKQSAHKMKCVFYGFAYERPPLFRSRSKERFG